MFAGSAEISIMLFEILGIIKSTWDLTILYENSKKGSPMKKESSQDIYFYVIGWCGIVLVLAYFFVKYIFNIDILDYAGPCTLYLWTGFYCPGCGGTRAILALVNGDMLHACYLHPFVPYAAVLGSWFMISQTIERISRGRIQIALHFRMVYVWIALALIFINVIYKNAVLLFTGIPPL